MRLPRGLVVALVLVIVQASFGSSTAHAQACSGQRVANFFAAQRGTTLLLVATGEHPTAGYSRSWTKQSGSKYTFVITPPPTGSIVPQVITPYRSRVRFTAPANLSTVTIREGGQSYTIPVTQLTPL